MIPILRDEGPRYALESSAPKYGPSDQRTSDPEGGILSKTLHGHPILRFFALTGATVAASGVATSLIKSGGMRLGTKLEDAALPLFRKDFQTSLIKDVRSVRDSFNAWETAVIGGPASHRGFYLTEAEHINSPAGDVFRRSVQRSLFKNARELPYTLPAMYLTQKAITDPLFGHNPNQKKVKWYNPFDVIGDFTQQSLKNIGAFVLPVEAGGPVAKDAWHKFLGLGNPNVVYKGAKGVAQNTSIMLQTLLTSVGHDSGEILASAAKYSQAGGSAFSAGLNESLNSSKGLYQHFRETRNANSSLTWAQALKKAVRDPEFGDVQIGPFGGMKSFAKTAKSTYLDAIEAAKLREDVLSGRRKLSPAERANAGLHYQGTSSLQEIAESIFNLVGDDVDDPRGFSRTRFFKGQMTTRYKRLLEKELRTVLPTGTQSDRDIAAFLRKIEVTNVGELARGEDGFRGNRFYRRVKIGDSILESYNREPDRYLGEFNSRLRKARISKDNADIITQNIGGLVRRTDRNLHLNYGTYSREIRDEFESVYRNGMLGAVKGKLGHAKVPFEALGGDLDPEAASILVRALGEKYGMPAGMSESAIRAGLKRRGVNMFDPNSFRGALVDAGLAAPPHYKGGFNLFGFRQLTAERAMERDFFAHMTGKQRSWIGQLVSDIENNEPGAASLGRLRVGRGIYETRSGKIVDFSGLYSGGRTALRGLSDRVQIPLIKLQPLNTLGFSAYRTMSEGQFFRYSQGYTGHFGVGGRADESYLWMRAQGAKGRVMGFGTTAEGELNVRKLDGLYRHHAGDAASLIGRQLRYAIGEEGRFGQDDKSRFQRMFGLKSEHESMASAFRDRWSAFKTQRAGNTDLTNPMQLARRLVNDPAFLNTASPEQRVAASKGWLNLERDLSRTRISARAMRRLGDIMGEDSPFSHPKVSFKRSTTASGAPRELIDLLEHGSIDEHAKFARRLLHEDSQFADPEIRQTLNRAQSRLWESLNQQSAGHFEQQASMASRNVGIARRADEFREQLKRYLIIRQAAISGGSPIQELLHSLDLAKGRLTSSEYQEARAAVLGTQIDFMRARQEPGRRDLQQSLVHLMSNFAGRTVGKESTLMASVEMRQALEAYYSGHTFAAQSQYHGPGSMFAGAVRRKWHSNFAKVNNYEGYNPFGGNSDGVIFPTFGTAFKRHPRRAVASVLNLTNWSDPDAFSGSAVPLGHVFNRLNRYFEALGLGVDEANYRGGADFFARGMVGRVVLPAVAAATTVTALDATAGGMFHRKDRNGNRVYSPLVMGWGATGLAYSQAVAAGVVPGGQSYEQKKQELFEGEVPIRRGRWWALGSTPWGGGRIQYYRPSWYRRFKSGYKYTDDTFGSPMDRLLFGYDFSPLRPLDPYRFERKHYEDRPYPVTGEYFTGPWGPVTSALNATVGRFLKPSVRMHKAEVERQLGAMQAIGQYGMQSPYAAGPDQTGFIYTKVRGRPTVTTPAMASDVMNYNYLSGADLSSMRNRGIKNRLKRLRSPFRAPQIEASDGLMDRPFFNLIPGGTGGYPVNDSYGVSPYQRQVGYRVRADVGGGNEGMSWRRGGNFTGRSSPVLSEYFIPGQLPKQSASAAQRLLRQINEQYESASDPRIPVLNKNTLNQTAVPLSPTFGSRVMPRSRMTTQTSMPVVSSQFGYEMQELAGIYGFGFGSAREAYGFGNQDFSPRRPVLLSASRAYGAERSFWDMNLGGFGDAPLPFGGEFSNLEFSEIARRFIPHRRRDIREINPIANSMGKKHLWLPGSDYFINFHEGDPFSLIPEGEMRLPGKAYERLNKLHPDATGRYGVIDKFKILGDVAPYSQEYRAMSQVLRKGNIHLLEPLPGSAPREARAARNKEEAALWKEIAVTKKKVANKNKRVTFSKYTHVGQTFNTVNATITGRVDGSADKFYTDAFDQPVRLAGVRARGEKATEYIDKVLNRGDKVELTYDAGISPLSNHMGVIDAIIKKQGQDVSSSLLSSGYGHASIGAQTALEAKRSESPAEWGMNYLKEQISHRDTFFNKKFLPKRTAVEDWERSNVYGSTFPQWQDPVKDFLMPSVYKSMNRNPFIATAAMALVGGMFGVGQKATRVGAFIGGIVGFGASMFTNADQLGFNERFIPMHRKKEIAVEEYTDILKYVKFARLYGEARAAAVKVEGVDPESVAQELDQYDQENSPTYAVGPITARALQYRKEVGRTLYGADPYGDVMDLYQAIPKRKRDHFMEFINNPPVKDRKRILSTAGRLERRVYEAKWGLKVERRPELSEYFSEHELPDANWEGWLPDVPLEAVKLKMIQHEGLDASEMGYYPQQLQEANLLNPSYPNMHQTAKHGVVAQQLRKLMDNSNVAGNVVVMPSPYPGSRVQFDMGVA